MIHVFTLKFGNKYSPSLVNQLYENYEKYCSDFIFYCYTEDTTGLNPNIQIVDLIQTNSIKLHWHKIDFFKNNFVEYGSNDYSIIMDIDQIIVADHSDMVYRPVDDGCISSYTRWWSNEVPPINGGWYKFKSNTMQYVYDKFYKNPEHWQEYYYKNSIVHERWFGEQNFVYDAVSEKFNIDLMPAEWCAKYNANDIAKNIKRNIDYELLFGEPLRLGGEWASDLKIIHFCEIGNNPTDFDFRQDA